MIAAALDAPRNFPPLRQTVVPGDRVTIAVDPSIPECDVILEAISGRLLEAGVEAEGLTVLLPRATSIELTQSLPPGRWWLCTTRPTAARWRISQPPRRVGESISAGISPMPTWWFRLAASDSTRFWVTAGPGAFFFRT